MYTAQKTALCIVPSLFFESLVEVIRNYISSHKISKEFLYVNIVNYAVLYPIGGYWFIWKSGYGLLGFVLLKLVVDIFNFVAMVILLKVCLEKRSYSAESIKDICNISECTRYCKQFCSIFLGWFCEYLGMEIVYILVGSTQDPVKMQNWVILFALAASSFTAGCALSVAVRTDVSFEIGRNRPNSARKYAIMGTALNLLFFIIYGAVFMIYCEEIPELFSKDVESMPTLVQMTWITGFIHIVHGLGTTLFVLMRIIDRTTALSVISFVSAVFICDVLTYIVIYWTD